MKDKLHFFWHAFSQIMIKIILPLLVMFWLGSFIAVKIDRYKVQHAPSTDYVRYTSFFVNGAYEGEDVNFTVCREFKDRYRYEGDLAVFIVPDSNKPEMAQKVYSRAIGSKYNNQPCEAKRIKESDFHHSPGSYRMSFRVCFPVKYGYPKCSPDIQSNVYRIRTRPEDAASLIEYYQGLIDQLQGDVDPGSMAAPAATKPSSTQNNTVNNNQTTNNITNNTTQNAPEPNALQRVVNGVGNLIKKLPGV